MKRKPREEGDAGTWMNTYSDLVTLLLTFFVLLFSMSSVNSEKWEQFVRALSHPGDETAQVVLDLDKVESGDGPLQNTGDAQQLQEGVSSEDKMSTLPMDFNDLYEYLQSYVEEHHLENSVEVSKSGDSVVYIRFQNNIFFAPDRYDLRPAAYDVLGYIGDGLHNVEDEIYIISINGHTASVDYDYAVSDWRLSSERASSIAIYLEEEKEITPQKMRPMGYGRNFPVAPNDTPEGREKNRRVDMTIIKSTDSMDGSIDEELASLFDPSRFPDSGGVKDILTPDEANSVDFPSGDETENT